MLFATWRSGPGGFDQAERRCGHDGCPADGSQRLHPFCSQNRLRPAHLLQAAVLHQLAADLAVGEFEDAAVLQREAVMDRRSLQQKAIDALAVSVGATCLEVRGAIVRFVVEGHQPTSRSLGCLTVGGMSLIVAHAAESAGLQPMNAVIKGIHGWVCGTRSITTAVAG
ncbi:hypothetical protein MITS9504_01618 [Synechococcus sp. MIT S9504]|nr:hypothetical protein MITS9504_01618 [Synechococcus sp. MIT S9504]